jgi:hypothetical protein
MDSAVAMATCAAGISCFGRLALHSGGRKDVRLLVAGGLLCVALFVFGAIYGFVQLGFSTGGILAFLLGLVTGLATSTVWPWAFRIRDRRSRASD